ncbi:MAG TPA: sigma-70 family RNA polymerase sigma factor [Opitutaceae bacterium]|nr:sigma-70 family RNA polymerase sigma factor [Opitutaceae bacterium]
MDDAQLLHRYAADRADDAFAELVQRHINVVYFAALRRVGGDAHLADDVTQKVFLDLARKASALAGRTSLAGWLHTSTRFAAAQAVRTERRRRTHEMEAHMRNELNATPASDWDRIRPLIDEALDVLPPADRDAVLLHFFEGRSFAEVGVSLALSADAARMRVNRALDRLRAALARRGVASTGAALSGVLATQHAVAAPMPLASAVAGFAVQQARVLGPVSRLARWAQAVKASPALSVGGAMLVVGLLGGAAYSFWPSAARSTVKPSPVASTARSASEEATNVEVSSISADEIARSNPVSDPPPAVANGKTNPAVTEVSFRELHAEEQHLLKALWSREENPGTLPNHRWALRVTPDGEKFPDFAVGRRMLRLKGWVKVTANGAAVLTPAGLTYCAAHRDEIAAAPQFFKPAPRNPGNE